MTEIGLVGPGILGRTLALSLSTEKYAVGAVLSHSKVSSRRAVREMRRGRAVADWAALEGCGVILVAVPQSKLAAVLAGALDELPGLEGKHILLTGIPGCGIRASLERLTARGSHVGGILPIALFRRPSIVTPGTTFGVWGSAHAQRTARQLVGALGGKHASLDASAGAQALLAVAMFSGMLTASLELGVRRLVRAGVSRTRAIEALSPIAEISIQEHRRSRQAPPPPFLPTDCSELLRASESAEPLEAALCLSALRFAREDLR